MLITLLLSAIIILFCIKLTEITSTNATYVLFDAKDYQSMLLIFVMINIKSTLRGEKMMWIVTADPLLFMDYQSN